MKSPGISAFFLFAALATTTVGQAKSVGVTKQPGSTSPAQNPSSTRVRVLGQEPKAATPAANATGAERLQAHAASDLSNRTDAAPRPNSGSNTTANKPATATANTSRNLVDNASRTRTGHTGLKPTNFGKGTGTIAPVANTTAPPNAGTRVTSPPVALAASQVYRVGVRDVLDIQLSEHSGRSSTLFTVLEGGVLEYPFAGGPIPVAGLTTNEIAAVLRQRIKIFDNPAVTVNVRDYASHAVTVNGFVAAPGTKTLRREAVPLYAILAESLVLPEAARATITRQGRAPIIVDLKDADLSATLVVPGDAIKVSGLPAGPTEFFFIGGEIQSPGQKAFSAGLTLTQAIMASGGTSADAGSKVKVSREGADRLLVTEEYNLRKILSGKLPDPLLQKGDRIEVTDAN